MTTDSLPLTPEERHAIEAILDRPFGDPDDDAAIAARAAIRLDAARNVTPSQPEATNERSADGRSPRPSGSGSAAGSTGEAKPDGPEDRGDCEGPTAEELARVDAWAAGWEAGYKAALTKSASQPGDLAAPTPEDIARLSPDEFAAFAAAQGLTDERIAAADAEPLPLSQQEEAALRLLLAQPREDFEDHRLTMIRRLVASLDNARATGVEMVAALSHPAPVPHLTPHPLVFMVDCPACIEKRADEVAAGARRKFLDGVVPAEGLDVDRLAKTMRYHPDLRGKQGEFREGWDAATYALLDALTPEPQPEHEHYGEECPACVAEGLVTPEPQPETPA